MIAAPDPTDEIARLEAQLRELKAAWAEFEHQARRHRDAQERGGGILGAEAIDARQLYRNLADNEAEQARVGAEIAGLRARLAGPPEAKEESAS